MEATWDFDAFVLLGKIQNDRHQKYKIVRYREPKVRFKYITGSIVSRVFEGVEAIGESL